ncbi:MAG: class I SAM-dependent methyltransferase [Dehalococcoidia bacterium]|jgi:SAM-dependent methyltransferase|nr:class I SAM-dependent methyltransferase [Dehalococcoidia bacterium]
MEPQIGDAFGQTLLACLAEEASPGRVFQVIEREDGEISAADAASYFERPSGDVADWVMSRAQGTVLDIGAGAGRYSLALRERGHAVTALDVSEGAIDVCRERGVADVYLGDVQSLARSGVATRFDTLLLMGNNLGLLGGREAAPGFLAALAELATNDVRILAEGNDASTTDEPVDLAYHGWNRERGRLPGQVRIRVRHGHIATEWFDYLMPSLDELRSLLEGSAWAVRDVLATAGSRYLVEMRRAEKR